MEKIEFDHFTLNIDISSNFKFSTSYLFKVLISNVKNKLYVMNYSAIDMEKIISESEPELFQLGITDLRERVVLIQEISKSILWIEDYINSFTQNDVLFIVGGERLVPYSKTLPVVKTKFLDFTTQVHFLEGENWNDFAVQIDTLFGKMQQNLQGIFVNINTDDNCRKIIIDALNKSENMSITCTEEENQNNEYEKIQKEIFLKYQTKSLSEILNIIENYKNRLDNNTYLYMTAMAYIQHGDISNAITIFENNYANLRKEEKLILSDILTVSGEKERAKQILNTIFEIDKFQKGLMPAILRAYEGCEDEEIEKWLNIAIEVDPMNPSVLEFYGNWLSSGKRYSEAAKVFRQIKSITNPPYYELVARMHDLLDNPPKKASDAEAYIYNIIDENPDLNNEAMFRLANFFINTQESLMPAYSALKSADIEIDKPNVINIIKLKLDILSDVVKASKALRKLKPFSKSSDADILSNERAKVLIEAISILSSTSDGYLFWRDFIEKCQMDTTWRNNIYSILLQSIIKFTKLDYTKALEQSEIEKIENNHDEKNKGHAGLMLLRRIKSGEISIEENFNDIDEFINGSLKYAEMYGDIQCRLWSRYYISIILSLKGEHQLSNNHALGLFDHYSRVDVKYKYLCIYLGLISWGNSQYRLGREVEGVACIIAAFDFAVKLNEFYPFVEEGVNIIVRFLSDNEKLIKKQDMPLLNTFYEALKDHSQSLDHMWQIFIGNADQLLEKLKSDIYSEEVKDTDWAGKVVNLIAIYIKKGNIEEVLNTLNLYADEAIEKLGARIDMRAKVAYNWAQIYFYNIKNIDGFKKSIGLLEIAIEDVEKRRNVDHKEERASLGEVADQIYRFYLQICSIIYALKDSSEYDRNEAFRKIESTLPRISPRSIIEQKNYNATKILTPEMKEMKLKLRYLTEEYNNLYINNNNDHELLLNKGKDIDSLTSELKKIHPHYKPLPLYGGLEFRNVQKRLNKGEIFYQYFVTNMTVVSLLITQETISLNPKLIRPNKMSVEELANLFGNLIQSNHIDNEIVDLGIELSRVVADDLINYTSKNEVERVYIMQDFKLGLFPILISSFSDISLIDNVKSIINVIDYSVIGDIKKLSESNFRISNRIFGVKTDSELIKISKWLEKKKDDLFLVMDNNSDDISDLNQFNTNNGIKTMVIYGHGVPDPKASLVDGAQGIEGQKQLIRLEDIIDNSQNINNLVLISCRGGSPISKSPENSSGSWTEIFEKFSGNIISCKWDVPTDSTIYVVNEMIDLMKEKKLPIDEALLIAQREAKLKFKDIVYWAGLEFWIN